MTIVLDEDDRLLAGVGGNLRIGDLYYEVRGVKLNDYDRYVYDLREVQNG